MGRSESYSFFSTPPVGPFDLNHLEEEYGFIKKNGFPVMCGGDDGVLTSINSRFRPPFNFTNHGCQHFFESKSNQRLKTMPTKLNIVEFG